MVTRIAITNNNDQHIIGYRCPIINGVSRVDLLEESVHVLDIEKMYAMTLGTDKLRPGGISGERLDCESEVGDGRVVPTSNTHQESKCSNERSGSRVVKVTRTKRRKSDIPVVSTSRYAGRVAGNDVGTGNRRSSRNRTPNVVTNMPTLGCSANLYEDVCSIFTDPKSDLGEENEPASTREALSGPHREGEY